MLEAMTQTTSETWCARMQAKLMAAIDAAWAMIEASDDPAVLRKARDRVKACGEMAAMSARSRRWAGGEGLRRARWGYRRWTPRSPPSLRPRRRQIRSLPEAWIG